MSANGKWRERATGRLYAASSDTSSAKSLPTYVGQKHLRPALDKYRSLNASVETFFKSLKAELIWRQSWPTRRQAEAAIFQYINGFYNTRRRHSYLGGISPLAFEAKVA
ncbi:integrase [Sphingobium sp. Ant17]|nr:integrase [Sphingobium sp. Ant17]